MANLICTYSITNTSSNTRICNDIANVLDILYNGVSIGVVKEYRFKTTGQHTLEFVLRDDTVINANMFFSKYGDEQIRLMSVVFPNTVKTIGAQAFMNTLIQILVIGESVTTIGKQAFYDCMVLTTVEVSKSVTTINEQAFQDCRMLTSIETKAIVAPTTHYSAFNNVASGGTLYYPAGSDYSIWLSKNNYYLGYNGWKGVEVGEPPEPELPDGPVVTCTYSIVATYPATKICNNTESFSSIFFNGRKMDVTTEYVFSEIGAHTLEYVLKGNKIGDNAFEGCDSLVKVTIGEGINEIGNNAFKDNNIYSLTLGNDVKYIGDSAFYGSLHINHSLTFHDSVISIGVGAFEECVFSKDYTELVIPDSVTYIGGNAFYCCENLETVIIGSGVTKLDSYTFSGCHQLSAVTIGSGVKELGEYVFFNTNLTKIYAEPRIAPTIYDLSFNGVYLDGTLYYPAGSDYSAWLNYSHYSLGYYGWVGVEVGDVPPVPDEPDEPSINLEYDRLTAPQGGITSTLDIETNGIDDIEIIAPEWVIVTDKGGYYEIEVLPNEEGYRGGEITIIGNPNKPNKVQQNIIITQKGNEEAMATSIGLNKTRLDFPSSGGTKQAEVYYINAQTINTPTCSQSWVTIQQVSSTTKIENGDLYNVVTYDVTMNTTSFARQTNITFSCTDSKGNTISQNRFALYQSAPVVDLPLPKITLEKTEMEFDSNGEASNFGVKVEYEDATTILEPISSDWITVTELIPMQGQSPYTKRYGISPSTTTEYREGTVHFRASNENGTATSDALVIKQNAPVVEDKVLVGAFTTTGTVNYDGSSTGISIISLACGYKNATSILEPMVSADWIVLGEGVVQDGVNYTYDTVIRYPITFETNTGAERTGTITFMATDAEGNEYTSVTTIKQLAAPSTPEDEPELPEDTDDITYSPIWKDVEYTFVDDTEYGIYYDRVYYFQGKEFKEEILLFKGKAYLPPNSDRVLVNINKICQNYMSENRNIFDGSVAYSHSFNEFKLKNGYGTLLHTYRFVNDWSYKELILGIKTNPIIPHIGDGQKLFFSAFATDKKTIKWGMRYYDGTVDYDSTKYITNDFETLVVTESRQKYVNTFYFGDKSFTVLPKCQCKYVLYYVNPNGGYDWLPITGKVVRKDKVETFVYTKNYNNTTADFGKNRYLANITVSYNLNTGWLTQEQSDRMWEVLESNTVWLHNLEEDKIYPVMITDTNIEHKQKFGKKRRLNYSINVELSHTRERV